jgi:AcrR family transcriptional regulator
MKMDRRKQRTQKLLREALIALILEKGYDAITVQDITDRANLGRATFYLHYRDKDELLLGMMEEILRDAVKEFNPVANDLLEEGQPPSLLAFKHAEENADLYRAIFGGGGLAGVLSHYRKLSSSEVQAQLETLLPGKSPVPFEILANFIVGALNTMVIWWLENDRPFPPEYMANIFHQLITSGLQGTFSDKTDQSKK